MKLRFGKITARRVRLFRPIVDGDDALPLPGRQFSSTALFGLIACLAGSLTGHIQAAPPADYYLVWSDEFNDPSLDQSKWNLESGVRNNAVNTPEAVSLDGSNLVITTFTTNHRHYTDLVQSAGKFNPRYGYTEARIEWGDSPGMWSAFWIWTPTMNQIGNPSVYGAELDI